MRRSSFALVAGPLSSVLFAQRLSRFCQRLGRRQGRRTASRFWRRAGMNVGTSRQMMEALDQIGVVAILFALSLFDFAKNDLDTIDGGKDQGHGIGSHRHSVAEPAHQSFGRVRQSLQSRESEKAAGSFDGMNEAKNIAEDVAVVRLVLETDYFGIDPL